jgi:hypothetical protein
MPILTLLIVVFAVACGTGALFAAVRRRRTPKELRGDWWTPFEREFRAYARQVADRERQRRRHRGERA